MTKNDDAAREKALADQAEQARKDQEARDQVERLKAYEKYRNNLNRDR